ncbi:hypothetical protein [Frankia sp. Cr1]|nr:hypothetical protein [Frankia sp. Cr1]
MSGPRVAEGPSIDEYIRRIIDEAPPLEITQIAQLHVLLGSRQDQVVR